MSTAQEIEAAITRLPPKEYLRVRRWFWARDNELWDRQIAADSAVGRHDHLVKEIEEDIAAGRTQPLDEIIHDA
ncbi:MAG TPA: hypothetical protein VHC95_13445 [Opitutales bacterium]|nr:hypothetical protein [Opitutales bacterium]